MSSRDLFRIDMWPAYGLLIGPVVGGVVALPEAMPGRGVVFGAALGLIVGGVVRGNPVD